jgi:hypothetical protein
MTKIKWLTGGFIFILVLIIVIANLGLGPAYFPFFYKIPGLDKIGHFFLTGLLSYFVNTLFNGKKVKVLSLSTLKGSLVVFTIVALEELSQILLVYRAFSILDLGFDLAGIIIFGRLADYFLSPKTDISNTEQDI